MKKNYPEITRLRGMAIIMVLLYHSILVFPINLHEIEWCKNLHTLLWYIQMPLFFLVSGFCYSYTGSYFKYFLKKAKRILIPHLIFGLADMTLRVLPSYIPELAGMVNQKVTFKEAIVSFFLYGGEDPFLRSLFIMSVAFPLVAWIMNHGMLGKTVAFTGAGLAFLFQNSITNIQCLDYISSFFIYYVIGYWCKNAHYETIKKKLLSTNALLGGIVLLAVGSILVCNHIATGISLPFGMISVLKLWGVLIAIGGALIVYRFCAHMGGFADNIFTAAGKYSLTMYLLCGYALVVSRTIIVGKLGITTPVMVIVFNSLVDFVVLWFISRYVIKPCRFLCFICGMNYEKKNKKR